MVQGLQHLVHPERKNPPHSLAFDWVLNQEISKGYLPARFHKSRDARVTP